MELKELSTALYDWAEQNDNKRTVLLITSEKVDETEEGYRLGTSQKFNGKIGQMTEALVDAMKEDKGLAAVITKAFLAYTMQHSSPVGIGVITINNGKEAKDEQ